MDKQSETLSWGAAEAVRPPSLAIEQTRCVVMQTNHWANTVIIEQRSHPHRILWGEHPLGQGTT